MPPLSHSAGSGRAGGSPDPGVRRRRLQRAAAQQPAQCGGVADGVAAAVVVEIHEDVFAGRLPFADPVRPPAQVVVGVGPAVQVRRGPGRAAGRRRTARWRAGRTGARRRS